MIRDNLMNVEKRINAACERSNRKRNDVQLIAVSKTHPLESVIEAMECSITQFGENKPQELKLKCDEINKSTYNQKTQIDWHMIGHLQRNKVKYVVGRAALIHSIDSISLAEEIEKESTLKGIITNVLIEINIAGEDTKYGIQPEALIDFLYKISTFKHVKVLGLMTIAPNTAIPEENRVYFRKMYQLYVDIRSKNIDNISVNELSMGMTNDFEVAIEEGATMIRIGTGIFGIRDYT